MKQVKTKSQWAMLLSILNFDEEHIAKIWCALNCHRWPSFLDKYQPKRWKFLTHTERSALPEFKNLFKVVSASASDKARLREWNRREMDDKTFKKWWVSKRHWDD